MEQIAGVIATAWHWIWTIQTSTEDFPV